GLSAMVDRQRNPDARAMRALAILDGLRCGLTDLKPWPATKSPAAPSSDLLTWSAIPRRSRISTLKISRATHLRQEVGSAPRVVYEAL
ncbi:MAG TPA: hypothetical protein PK095_04025, partial [Myxococcota bacterium]|nr:hypothetical protein [Myxococcota bacterium]